MRSVKTGVAANADKTCLTIGKKTVLAENVVRTRLETEKSVEVEHAD